MHKRKVFRKIAIVLFNLGGPSSLKEVRPFLFSLFNDPAIIRLNFALRFIIAKIISITRNKKSQLLYSLIGNKSPILEETISQKELLEQLLQKDYALHAEDYHNFNQSTLENKKQGLKYDFKCFVSMRHAEPKITDTLRELDEFGPDEILLLPLYPQFSTTTTGSYIKGFVDCFNTKNNRLKAQIKAMCCYPHEEYFIEAHSILILNAVNEMLVKLSSNHSANNKFRLLFSAHSLPVSVIDDGDPYQWQIEYTVRCIIDRLKNYTKLQDFSSRANLIKGLGSMIQNLDYKICYQSKIGPVKWLEPSTEVEIKMACKENISLIVIPIAFVSEHVETLVELDIEYKNIVDQYNASNKNTNINGADSSRVEYLRVSTLRINELYIKSILKMIKKLLHVNTVSDESFCFVSSSDSQERICPPKFNKCICRKPVCL